MVALPRDRFAGLRVDDTATGNGDYQMPVTTGEVLTAAISRKGEGPLRFYMNADGLGKEARLKVELLSANAVPLPDYAGAQAAVVTTSGFQTPIVWNGQTEVTGLPERYRLRVTFEGEQKTKIRFSALYVRVK